MPLSTNFRIDLTLDSSKVNQNEDTSNFLAKFLITTQALLGDFQ